MGIFFSAEVVADSILVYVLDRWFGLPFLRLPLHKSKGKFVFDIVLLSLVISGLSLGILIVNNFLNKMEEW